MLDKTKVKLGIAPIAWTNDDLPDLGGENTFEQCVSEMALAGFTGSEVGNKYPKNPEVLKKALSLRGIEICNAWFSTSRPYEETEKAFEEHVAFLAEMGAKVVGVSEQSYSTQGIQDQPIFEGKHVMNDEEWKLLTEGLNRLGKLSLEKYGVSLTFHHHMGTVVQPLRENIFHICRGSILELEGLSFLCFGGGESPDKDDRDPGVNWWPREMPSDEEYAFCDANAAAHGYRVQYVLTHDAPSRFLDFTILPAGANNRLHAYFDKLVGQMNYDQWLFGCYHRDTRLSPKVRCLFEDVVTVGQRKKWWKRL